MRTNDERTSRAIDSVSFRAETKHRHLKPSRTKSATTSAASAYGERRIPSDSDSETETETAGSAASFSSLAPLPSLAPLLSLAPPRRIGGCQRMTAFSPAGAPDSATTTGVLVVSASTCSPGLDIVADVAMNSRSSLPHRRAKRRVLLSTHATWLPATPLCACASSRTTHRRFFQNSLVHFRG